VIKVSIANEGNEDARNINLKLRPSEYEKQIRLEQPSRIKRIEAGEKESLNLSITASRQLPTGM